jgi:hypothetical protein
MSTARFGSAAWRRLLLATITALIALLAVSASAPGRAEAFMDPNIVTVDFVGWVHVREYVGICATSNPPRCTDSSTVQAWRWTGTRWSATRIGENASVYAYPYSGSWEWIWTQRTGWLAIQRSSLTRGYSCTGYACPVF